MSPPGIQLAGVRILCEIVSVGLYQSIHLIEIDAFEVVDGLTRTRLWLLSAKHL